MQAFSFGTIYNFFLLNQGISDEKLIKVTIRAEIGRALFFFDNGRALFLNSDAKQ
jgi:hypothetical protein